MAYLYRVVTKGDRVASLRALRNRLAKTLEEAPPSAVAPLSKQLCAVMAELETLAPKREDSKLDDLASQRAKRRAAASDL